eukprot:2466146-Pleurochrysis_carterae.AAC.3
MGFGSSVWGPSLSLKAWVVFAYLAGAAADLPPPISTSSMLTPRAEYVATTSTETYHAMGNRISTQQRHATHEPLSEARDGEEELQRMSRRRIDQRDQKETVVELRGTTTVQTPRSAKIQPAPASASRDFIEPICSEEYARLVLFPIREQVSVHLSALLMSSSTRMRNAVEDCAQPRGLDPLRPRNPFP